MKLLKWTKNNPRHALSLIAGFMIGWGVMDLLPRSPWTLIVIGCLILFGVFVSLMPASPGYGPK